ncbi:hypothetical protein Y032_0443g1552 [Ancylostoma ceylanicum]|nr:hypothetical protein Y032_0443g1552 [Ancylostoma ceylanicum]
MDGKISWPRARVTNARSEHTCDRGETGVKKVKVVWAEKWRLFLNHSSDSAEEGKRIKDRSFGAGTPELRFAPATCFRAGTSAQLSVENVLARFLLNILVKVPRLGTIESDGWLRHVSRYRTYGSETVQPHTAQFFDQIGFSTEPI